MSISRRATSDELGSAQAVVQISDTVTMQELEGQRVYVKFFCKLGKNFTETFKLLNQAKQAEFCVQQVTACHSKS
jgi:hypothetical protein